MRSGRGRIKRDNAARAAIRTQLNFFDLRLSVGQLGGNMCFEGDPFRIKGNRLFKADGTRLKGVYNLFQSRQPIPETQGRKISGRHWVGRILDHARLWREPRQGSSRVALPRQVVCCCNATGGRPYAKVNILS